MDTSRAAHALCCQLDRWATCPDNDEVTALRVGYNGTSLWPPVEDELTSTAICSVVVPLPDAALEGDKEALGPPSPIRPFTSALVSP
jgi:hypothetical protein